MLRKPWNKQFSFDWKFGFGLILFFSISRFVAVLYGIQSGDNQFLSILFLLMITTPFIFLNEHGRKNIGFKKPDSFSWIILSLVAGILMAAVIFFLGKLLYQSTYANWFYYIGSTYPVDFLNITPADKQIYFIIFSLIGISFSPFGEEILYRGVVHGALETKYGDNKAAFMDSLAFAIVHLAHFGIVWINEKWSFMLIPALLWMLLMFLTGILFNFYKRKTDSIWGAIICHMGFNVSMTWFIFYQLF